MKRAVGGITCHRLSRKDCFSDSTRVCLCLEATRLDMGIWTNFPSCLSNERDFTSLRNGRKDGAEYKGTKTQPKTCIECQDLLIGVLECQVQYSGGDHPVYHWNARTLEGLREVPRLVPMLFDAPCGPWPCLLSQRACH